MIIEQQSCKRCEKKFDLYTAISIHMCNNCMSYVIKKINPAKTEKEINDWIESLNPFAKG